MNKYKRILLLFLANMLVMLLLMGCGNADAGAVTTAEEVEEAVEATTEETADTNVKAEESTADGDIVILYTNDVHTYVDGPISYDVISAVKKELQKEYEYVYLVDAGDHIQGTAYGSMDNGETIIEMMNAAEYDVATLGNHEFDYGMFGCMKAIDMAEYPYVSCNFHHEADGVCGENVLNSYELLPAGEETIAVIGITTPETFTKTTPAYFQDEEGNFIYGIQMQMPALEAQLIAIANMINAYVHFTKPDKGPLADFDTYGPDMIKEFVGGIESQKGRLEQAMTDIAETVSFRMPAVAGGSVLPYSVSSGSGGGGGSDLALIIDRFMAALETFEESVQNMQIVAQFGSFRVLAEALTKEQRRMARSEGK